MDVQKLKIPALAGAVVVMALIAGVIVLSSGRKNPQPAVMAAPADSRDIFAEELPGDEAEVSSVEAVEAPKTQAVVDETSSVVPVAKPEMKSETIEPAKVAPVEKPQVAEKVEPKVEQPETVVEVAEVQTPTAEEVVTEVAIVEKAAADETTKNEPDFTGSKTLENSAQDAAAERKTEEMKKPSLADIDVAAATPVATTQLSKAIDNPATRPTDDDASKSEPQIAAVTRDEKEQAEPENVIESSPEVIGDSSDKETSKAGWFNAPVAGKVRKLESDSFTLDGTPGGFITPKAYLVNPGREGEIFGLPAVGVRFTSLGTKDIESFAIGETFFGRIELSYALSRMGLGTLKDEFRKKNGVSVDREVYLHTFGLRGLVIKENEFGQWTPAVTAGVAFKYNDGIRGIDNKLGGALSNIGMARSNGVDYTLTATKTLDLLGRPLTLSAGMRFSQAAQLGFLGFGDAYRLTFEGNASYALTDWLRVGYEFRQKDDPYRNWSGVVGGEDNWQAITADIIVNDHLTLQGAYGLFGNFANASADGTWSVMLNWQF